MTNQHSFIVLGTGGRFTYQVIQTLINNNHLPIAYVQFGKNPEQKLTTFSNIELEIKKPESLLSELLKNHNIPIYYQSQIKIDQFLKKNNAEYLLVACWPKLIGDKVLKAVSKAALNLHPSLLPDFRGIDPISDQIKKRNYNFGISLHLISDTYDTGDIVLQQSLNKNINRDKTNIETETAVKGAELFVKAVHTFETPGWTLVSQYKNQELKSS